MPPLVVCLDLEGVLIPEVWIAFAEKTGIDALRRTTRDEPDYDKLMRGRLEILDEHGFKLSGVSRRASRPNAADHPE
jgi:phosphoserine/homoserine phosphotransferase